MTHDCNMRCRYCYGASGPDSWKEAPYLYGTHQRGMSYETARNGVDFLFAASGPQKDLSLIFFGGEPLLGFDLIKRIVPYVRQKEKDTHKRVNFSLSTNGLLLKRDVVGFLVQEHIGCQVSMDGSPLIHNRTRRMIGGQGSYKSMIDGVKRLIAARPRRSPGRVTLSHGAVDIPVVVEHLLNVGFASVHVEPARGKGTGFSVTPTDLPEIKKQNEEMAAFLVNSVRKGRFFNYTDLVRYIRQTRVIRNRQAHYQIPAGLAPQGMCAKAILLFCAPTMNVPRIAQGNAKLTLVSPTVVDSSTRITAVVGAGSKGRITVTTDGGTATSAGVFTYIASIPTLNEWAMLLFGLLLLGSAVFVLRRRQKTI